MRLFIFILFASFTTVAFSQSGPLYGTAVGYVNGVPAFTPNIAQKGSEICVSINKKTMYLWNRDSSAWKPVGGISVNFGVPVAAPVAGGTRTAINMQTGFIYRWDGVAWRELIATAVSQGMDYTDAVANILRGELADSTAALRAYVDAKPAPRTKRDTTIFVADNSDGDLSSMADVLGGRNWVTIIITKPNGINATIELPSITDTLRQTKFSVKVYCENASESSGIFQNNLGFVTGWDGTQYIDNSSVYLMADLSRHVLTPVEDVNGLHWSTTKTSADGNGIYSGSDSLSQENTYAAMAADGSQNFGIGYFPDFPQRTYGSDEYGFINSRNESGEISILNGETYLSLYSNGNFSLVGRGARNRLENNAANQLYLGAKDVSSNVETRFTLDSIGYHFESGGNVYSLPNNSEPSPTGTNILKWTAGVPSFGLVPNWYNEDGTLSVERTTTLSGSNGDYYILNGTSNSKILDLYFSADGQYNNDSYFTFEMSKTNQTNNYGNFNWSHYVYGPSGKNYSIAFNGSAKRSSSNNTGVFYDMDLRRASGTFVTKHLMQIDSVGRFYNYLEFKSDSLAGAGRKHISGFAFKTQTSGQTVIVAPTKSWLLQTNFYNSSTKFDWLRVDNLDTDTTSNRIKFYNGKYALPNATPSATSGEVSVINWLGTGSAVTPRISRIGDALSATARIIPYANSSGRLVLGNTYFRLDTTTSAGTLARNRLNLNKTFDISVPDSYTVLDIFAGDAANSGANMFVGDQTLGYITAGYDPRVMLYRYGGSLNSASNLSNGNGLGRFGFGGYVNGTRNNNLGGIFATYTGDGTTANTSLYGATANSGSLVTGWLLDNQSRFWLGSSGAGYYFPPSTAPATGSGVESELVWDGTGSGATPRWRVPKRDTTVSYNNVDYNLLSSGLTGAQVKNRYNRIIITGYVPSSGVSSDALLLLPPPSSDYNQVEIQLFALDENATWGIGISATTNAVMLGDGTYTDAYPGVTLSPGQRLVIRCQLDPKDSNNYKWTLGN